MHEQRNVAAILLLVGVVASSSGCSIFRSAKESKAGQSMGEFWASLHGDRPVNEAVARQAMVEADENFSQAMAMQGAARTRSLLSAVKKYEMAGENWQTSTLEEDAMFRMGECYFFADHYAKASTAYGTLLKKYPNSRYLDTVSRRRFSQAEYWLALDENENHWRFVPNFTDKRRPVIDMVQFALKELDQIRFDDPAGELADDATMRAATENFKRGKYASADELFDDLRTSFPSSPHQFQAHLLGIKCKQELFRGPDYEDGMLDDAEKLVVQVQRQFPEQAAEYRDLLQRSAADIRLKQADTAYAFAKFWDDRKEYRAARLYYDDVRKEYSDTNLALESEARLAQLGGLPDTPVERLDWIANLFPKDEQPKPLLASERTNVLKR
ncbi:MAG: tetratricopeptide repeat protein [Pirellulaceae bacterium]